MTKIIEIILQKHLEIQFRADPRHILYIFIRNSNILLDWSNILPCRLYDFLTNVHAILKNVWLYRNMLPV